MTAARPSAAPRAVFLHYAQDDLDRAYDQRVWAPDAEAALARCREAGEQVRATARMRANVAYGDGPDETLDIFPCGIAGAPVHVHLHGGAWRIQSKHDASFMAPAMTSAGMHFVAVDFTNLPTVRMTQMVDQIARALEWVYRNAPSFGGDPAKILVSGHSSGAHLAAVMLTQDFTLRGLPAHLIKAGLLVSGSYDLEPVLLSSRRLYIDVTTHEAQALSPARRASRINCPVTLLYGGRESPEFIRHALSFFDTLSAAGREVELIFAPDLDHFAMNEELGRAGSLPHEAAVKLARRPGAPV